MKPRGFIAGMALLCLFAVVSCSRVTTLSAFYATQPEYLYDAGDGSITVRTYGQGKNRQKALEQARKNAVREIIFKGINVPGNTSLSRPLVNEVNAAEKYEQFFNNFFQDNGKYAKFIDKTDSRKDREEIHWNASQAKLSTIIRIDRAELKAFLQQEGIIKTH